MIDVAAIHRATPSPVDLASLLGLEVGRQRLRDGVMVACPAHGERRPSCSLAERDGRILWRCHACGEGGDIFTLVAAVEGLDHRRAFPEVARRTAELLGVALEEPARSPRRATPRDPVVDLAQTVDRLGQEWLRGADLSGRTWPRADDVLVVAAASPEQFAEAMVVLVRLDLEQAARDDELERLADEYERATA
ncbi:MAG: hypothetical protein JNL21_27600 [Myxococcales bacterium]|nr:hypothetical protein [Myxococcales bacterium]